MLFKTKEIGEEILIKLTGGLDTAAVNDISQQFEDFITQTNEKNVKIDCAELEYISSSGLRLLLKLRKNTDKTITLKGVNAEITNILKITKLDDMFQYEE